jgi:fructose-bisphosphate aldolase class II
MTLVSIKEYLHQAQTRGYAVLLVDVADIHGAEGIFAALEAKRAPGIVAIYGGMMAQMNSRALAAYLRARAEEIRVPISLMLDHGSSLEQCIRAMQWGFTDVMFDGSRLTIEENIAITRQVVEVAHAIGVGVEAELGHVGQGSQYASFGRLRKGFTDPAEAERFMTETGVDFLAVAIGTAHGIYSGDPHIDLELLAEIRKQVPIPLVMHGGTGLSAEQFQTAITAGIAKINVATDMFISAGRRMKQVATQEDIDYFGFTRAATQVFQERCEYYLDLFGSSDKIN